MGEVEQSPLLGKVGEKNGGDSGGDSCGSRWRVALISEIAGSYHSRPVPASPVSRAGCSGCSGSTADSGNSITTQLGARHVKSSARVFRVNNRLRTLS